MSRGVLLDLFCGAGGASVGYARAGFEVIGVDINPQPHYPFEFVQADAMTFPLDGFDVIHASLPCQAYCSTRFLNRSKNGTTPDNPRFVQPIRERLRDSGARYIIENVPQAGLVEPITLCGSMFGLGVRRHRRFESNVFLMQPKCQHHKHRFVGVYGDHPERRSFGRDDGYVRAFRAATLAEAHEAMGMDWADWHGTKEAIPPAYTEFIGEQLMATIGQHA